MGWQESGSFSSSSFCLVPLKLVLHVLTLTIFLACDYWFGCRWESTRRGPWRNCVSVLHKLICIKLKALSLLWLISLFAQSTNIVHHSCCAWWQKLSISNIWTNCNVFSISLSSLKQRSTVVRVLIKWVLCVAGGSFRWNALHYFWHPVVSYSGWCLIDLYGIHSIATKITLALTFIYYVLLFQFSLCLETAGFLGLNAFLVRWSRDTSLPYNCLDIFTLVISEWERFICNTIWLQ